MVYSHWNQKASKNLIGLCALTLFSFSPVPYFFLSSVHMHVYVWVQARTHTHTHMSTQLNLYCHPPATGTSSSHAYSHMHTHFCHNHLYAKWLAAMGCYGCCYQVMWQEAASCFTSYLCQCKGVIVKGTYRAEDATTQHTPAHNGRRNNRDGDKAAQELKKSCAIMET